MSSSTLSEHDLPSSQSFRPSNRRHALLSNMQGTWTPGLGSIPDDQMFSLQEPSPPLLNHGNYSVPSLPSLPPHYSELANDTSHSHNDSDSALVGLSNLQIRDPIPQRIDLSPAPFPRSESSFPPRSPQLLRHPTAPDGNSYAPSSVQGTVMSGRHEPFDMEEQNGSLSRHFPPDNSNVASSHLAPSAVGQVWQSSYNGDYNSLYAAASDVLGIGPPPGAHPPPKLSLIGSGYSQDNVSYSNSQLSLSSQYSMSTASHYSQSSQYLSQQTFEPSQSQSSEMQDIEHRPSFPRAGTSASVTLTTHKSKAIDLSAPPFTKDYIDQYRQRIKTDPDPEAHFLYAKYLVDAAKHIRINAKDQRSAKKYTEFLITESLKVVRRLATQGNAFDEAQFFLANCYGTGALGLQVDHEKAYHLYLQAAKQNHAAASYRVAVCNEIGAGTRKEPLRAAAFYRKAASLGDTSAMYKLGMILLNGSLGEQNNPREAVNWLKRAAEQADEDNPHALHELGLLYEQFDSNLVPYDPAYAKSLFTQAAQLGYTQSQYKLGQCYEYGSLTCPIDPKRSIAWYTKAAEKGDAEAELALSGWYLTGSEGVLKQSDSEAYLWARRAANKGLGKAEYAVGYYAEVGIGIKQDTEFAKRWYMRAAAQGNKRAMNRLTEMKRSGNKRANVVRPTRQQAKDECVIC